MDTFTLVVAGLAAGAIILIALGISMAGSSGVTLERLERYAATEKQAGGKEGAGVADLIQRSAALAQLNKVVEKRDFGANLLRDLGAADLKLKPSEFLAIWAMVDDRPEVMLRRIDHLRRTAQPVADDRGTGRDRPVGHRASPQRNGCTGSSRHVCAGTICGMDQEAICNLAAAAAAPSGATRRA